MKLHEAIEKLLKLKDRALSTVEIADELNKRGWYKKKDGSLITDYQIHGRTKNYTHLFIRKGSLVLLIGKPIQKQHKNIKKKRKNTSAGYKSLEPPKVIQELFDAKHFTPASDIDTVIPNVPGIYCIKIKNIESLPHLFNNILAERDHNIIYIGIATKSIKKRLNQELRAKGHGSFFRSIGAVLGYRPIPGSLIEKKNKNNFNFLRKTSRR